MTLNSFPKVRLALFAFLINFYTSKSINFVGGGSRRGARGPLNHKTPIRWAESLGEASKIIKTPQPSASEYPSLGAGGRGAAFAWGLFPRLPGEPGQAREGAT